MARSFTHFSRVSPVTVVADGVPAYSRPLPGQHKFSHKISETIVFCDASSLTLARTRMANSVLDAGWGMLEAQLPYKASRPVEAFKRWIQTRRLPHNGG
jgi:hypothetical protein